MYLHKSHRATWAEINLEAIQHNLMVIRNIAGEKTGIIGVVKADAYGHGAINISRELVKMGVEYLAISNIDEAIELRNAGISSPLLLLGPIEPIEFGKIMEFNISPTITSLDYAKELSEAFKYRGVFAKVHIKIDTGMGRLGISLESALSDIEQISKMGPFIIDGVYSHFPSSDDDIEYSNHQLTVFIDIIKDIKKMGLKIKHYHIANSSGLINLPDSYKSPFSLIRPGLAIYGYSTTPNKDFKNSMSLKTKILSIRKMKKGETVSYLRQYTIDKDYEYIAVLPVGYADGIPTIYSGKGKVSIAGQYYPIVGRICMDYMMISINNNSSGIKSGDLAIIFGDNTLSVEDFAKASQRIPYEVTCDISKRVPRIYLRKEDVR